MASESLTSIELSLGALGVVLGLRLVTLLRVSRELPGAEALVQSAAESGKAPGLVKALKRFGYRLPFQVVATDLLSALSETEPKRRVERLTKTSRLIEQRIRRLASRGQAIDLLTLGLMAGVAAFVERTLPTTSAVWAMGGALFALVVATFLARRALAENVISSLGRVTKILEGRPELASLSEDAEACRFCSGTLRRETLVVSFADRKNTPEERVLGHVCDRCGTAVFRGATGDDTSSANWELN